MDIPWIPKTRANAAGRPNSSAGGRVLGVLLAGMASCRVDSRPAGVYEPEMPFEQPANGGAAGLEAQPILPSNGGAAGQPASSPSPSASGLPLPGEVTAPAMVSPPPSSTAPPASSDLPPLEGIPLDRIDPSSKGVVFGGATCAVARAGDINGDGRDDFLASGPGAAYAIFRPQQLAPASLSDIPTRLPGIVLQLTGDDECSTIDVAPAGDVNGDGFADFVVASSYRSYGGTDSGAAFVVFGGREPRSIAVSQIETGASDGFMIRGNGVVGLRGAATGAGDLNGDGLDDIVVSGTPGARVVFGKRDFAPVFVEGVDGDGIHDCSFRPSIEQFDTITGGVANLGDLNGDGIADLALASRYATVDSKFAASRVYVIWGGTVPTGSVSVDPNSGFVINGVRANEYLEDVGAAGDVNGDGIPDLLLEGRARVGSDGSLTGPLAYLIWGKADSAPIDLADIEAGHGGFVIERKPGRVGDLSADGATMLSSAGDLNGDGLDDLLLDAFNPGRLYVVYGRREVSTIAAADLNPPSSRGFTLLNSGGMSAHGLGDLNGDGKADLLIGSGSGLFVVYGPGAQ